MTDLHLTEEQQKTFDSYKNVVNTVIYCNFRGAIAKCGKLEIQNAGYVGLAYGIKTYRQDKKPTLRNWIIINVKYSIHNEIKRWNAFNRGEIISLSDIEQLEDTGYSEIEHLKTRVYSLEEPYIEWRTKKDLVAILDKIAKNCLTPREEVVYESLLKNGTPATVIAEQYGVTRTRISQIKDKILSKLRRELYRKGLLDKFSEVLE